MNRTANSKKDLTQFLAFLGACSVSYFYGAWVGVRAERKSKTKTIIESDKTCGVLMTVGMNALNDEIYDEDELRDMLEKADILIKED